MATFTKLALQPAGTTGTGRLIKVAATATAGTAIHTASSTATTIDEVWLYAVNSDTTARKLTIEWGGTSSPDDLIELTVLPESGLVTVVTGLVLQGNASPLVVRAFCASANVVMIGGFVNRIAA